MTEIERFILQFGKQNLKSKEFLIGNMKDEKTLILGEQEYEADDLMVATNLKSNIKTDDIVLVYPLSDEKLIILAAIEEL